MSLISCSGKRPSNLGVSDSEFAPCPSTPNCVSSDASASDAQHHISPLQLDATQKEIWQIIRETVIEMPRTRIIDETADYLHAECTSALLGFVDDLELHHRTDETLIAIRSASRLGSSDFGVNRKRVETLRDLLINRGIVLK